MPSTGTWTGVNAHLIWLLWFVDTARAQFGLTYKEPRLECLPDGIRLHIDPVGVFFGHVYVRGHFKENKCHLNYCTQSTREPFTMEVPYRGECNVRRHRSPNPLTITYEVTVVIQHHPLFITAGDRAYRLNCIYRQADDILTQKINVNDPAPIPLEGLAVPQCRYDVLTSINGPILRFANVGEPVVHKWTCNSDLHGFVVHSCVVRDPAGVEYKLIDERGCVIEKALIPDVRYATDLSSAYTTINAFRFAEQIVVHFACQITLCRKHEQGCEGIAPPTCSPIDFPPIHTEYRHSSTTPTPSAAPFLPTPTPSGSGLSPPRDEDVRTTTRLRTSPTPVQPEAVAEFDVFTTSFPPFPFPSPTKLEKENNTNDLEDAEQHEFGLEISHVGAPPYNEPAQGYRTETLSSVFDLPAGVVIDPMPSPTPAHIFYASNRRPRSHQAAPENITVEVEANEMLVFSSDDSDRLEVTSPAPSDQPIVMPCSRVIISQTVFLCAAALLQATSIAVILLQRRLYKRNVEELLLRIPSKQY
ncbi:hypothetical protein Y032_0339g2955 [Ancylostoma ceylanicum]|uniref:ZP domain-containing protein n=1 Tax=Ancylostoma ceylanicum TaxID=53326 RepID=A0A016RYS1_9BILA|nr:hypothetical protein Y032_0339g2955 [Ancylostoma ceylanicum]